MCVSDSTWSGTAPMCQGKWMVVLLVCVINCCTEVVCSDLPSLTDGDITYNTGSPNNRPIGTVATLTCTSSYILSGGSNRTCGNGGWSGSAATCQGTDYNYIV